MAEPQVGEVWKVQLYAGALVNLKLTSFGSWVDDTNKAYSVYQVISKESNG